MLILAFDTTSEVGGVGIFQDLECLAHVANEGPANRYSVNLFLMMDRAIGEAKVRHGVPLRGLADVDLIAVAAGPGSFTGIRVGLAAAQGWAKAFGLPICGVSVLQALVEAAPIGTDWAVPILDARRRDLFVGLFHRQPREEAGCEPSYVPAREGSLVQQAELGAFLTSHLGEWTGATCVIREHDRETHALREGLPSSLHWQAVAGTLVDPIARIAFREWRAGKRQAVGDLDAHYIRRSDAEVNWKG